MKINSFLSIYSIFFYIHFHKFLTIRLKHNNSIQAFDTSSNGTTSIKSTNTTNTINTYTSDFSESVSNNEKKVENNKTMQKFFPRKIFF